MRGQEFKKFDLRLWNSVYMRVGVGRLIGMVGDGWGQRHSKNTFANTSPERGYR